MGESIYPDSTPEAMLGSAKSTEFTHREIQVLRLLTTGEGNEEIAAKLKISQNTVKTHIKHLLERNGIHNTNTAYNQITHYRICNRR